MDTEHTISLPRNDIVVPQPFTFFQYHVQFPRKRRLASTSEGGQKFYLCGHVFVCSHRHFLCFMMWELHTSELQWEFECSEFSIVCRQSQEELDALLFDLQYQEQLTLTNLRWYVHSRRLHRSHLLIVIGIDFI